jgi:hypothetical protein
MALRDYNTAVDFVDRNVAEGRGDTVEDLPNFKTVVVVGGGPASVPRQDSIFRSIAKLELGRPLSADRAPMWRSAAYLKFCVIWRWAC